MFRLNININVIFVKYYSKYAKLTRIIFNRQIIALIRILFCSHYKLLLIHISEFKIISL